MGGLEQVYQLQRTLKTTRYPSPHLHDWQKPVPSVSSSSHMPLSLRVLACEVGVMEGTRTEGMLGVCRILSSTSGRWEPARLLGLVWREGLDI